MNLVTKSLVMVALTFTLGCDAWKKVKQTGSETTTGSFKENFLTSCGRKAPDKLQYCECFYNGLEQAQVTNETEAKIMEYIKSPGGIKIAEGCLKALVAANPALIKPTPGAKSAKSAKPAAPNVK